MYAIIADSGSQYKVQEGDVIRVDLRDVADDQTSIDFDRVLMVGGSDAPAIGAPYVDGAKVSAEIIDEEKADKVMVVKFKRRKGYRRRNGHRQRYLKVKITPNSK
ncbi:MAG: 50S ribosomal protein L21 [Planctomycetota bacterium]